MRRIVVLLLVIGSSVFATSAWEATTSQNVQITVTSGGGGGSLLPADRDASANWKMAGLQSIGGIPNRTTQCGTTLNPSGGDDVNAINAAISQCPVGQVVQLGTGTFIINSGHVAVNKAITLRGSGPGTTILHSSNGATLGSYHNGAHSDTIITAGGSGGVSNTTSLAADAAVGSYSIQVTSPAGFAVGRFVHIDELAIGQPMPDCCFNGGTGKVWAMPDYRVAWNAHNPAVQFWDSTDYSNAFTSGDACAYSVRCGGVNEEIHQISAISGNTITFDSPLTMSYRTANSAQVRALSGIVQQAGIENLTMSNGDNGNLIFSACAYCWAKTVESTVWLNAGGFAFYESAFRDQIEQFWVHNAAWPVNGGGGYAINLTYGASEILVENGISMLANKVIVVRASGAGSVVAYNYMDDAYIDGNAGWIETGMNCSHLAGSHHVLFEGNQTFNTDSDFTHGSSGHCTYFRNWVTGFRAPFNQLSGAHIDDTTRCCGPLRAISDHPYSYWESFIGNVLGTSGHMSGWTYRCAQGPGGGPCVIMLGWNDSSVSGALPDGTMGLSYPTAPNSTITGPGCQSSGSNCTPIVDGNFDYLTNSIQWASNDTVHTLPNSFYVSNKPVFFTGGASVWPPVDPINGVVHPIPAKARYDAGTPFTQP